MKTKVKIIKNATAKIINIKQLAEHRDATRLHFFREKCKSILHSLAAVELTIGVEENVCFKA